MDELEKYNAYPSTSALAKQGINAICCIGGSVLLFVFQTLTRFRVVGLAAGLIACIIGIVSLMSKDPEDHKPGALITGAGVLVMLSIIGPLKVAAGTLLTIGAFGLLAVGVLNGIRFLKALKKRS